MKNLITTIILFFGLLCTVYSDNINQYYIEKPNTSTIYDSISGINLPGIENSANFDGEILLTNIKMIIARLIEYLPFLILILLLLACLKIIFDGDKKEGFKRIKYILIGLALTIILIYIINILSTIITGFPIINIRLNYF